MLWRELLIVTMQILRTEEEEFLEGKARTGADLKRRMRTSYGEGEAEKCAETEERNGGAQEEE